MPRKPNTETRRAQIVAALLATMAAHGYEKATIQLIARHAGLTPGLVHYHFKTKAEILHDLIKTLAALSRQRYLAFSASASTPGERLRAYIQARLAKGEGADPAAVAAWVVIGAEAVRQPEVRTLYQQVVGDETALLEGLIGECMPDRDGDLAPVKALTALLLAMIEGAFQLSSAAPDVIPPGSSSEMAIALVEAYIASVAAAAIKPSVPDPAP